MASSSSSDLSMSFTQDSDEYHEMHCEQCELYNEKSTAEGFCVECMEYMCTVCLKYHTRQNPGHRQQDKNSMPQDFCFEKCCTHTNRLIKYYCFKCKKFACNECKLTDHEKCTDIGHVPTVAKNVENSEELKDLFKGIKTLDTELERFKDRLDAEINRSSVQENTLITAKSKQKEDMNRHIQEQKQLITDTYDREVEKTVKQLQAEKQKRIDQLSKNHQQLDDELSKVLSTIDLRHTTEKTTLQHFQAMCKNVSSETKDLALDIEQKQKTGERSNIFITMKHSEQILEKQRQEYLGLQKVVDEQKMDDSTHELFTALNEFKIVEQTYTLDFGATQEEACRFGILASNLFISEWKRHVSTARDETEESVLVHAMTWTPFPYYLEAYYPKRLDILTEECVQYLVQAISVLENVVTRLSKGTLNIGVFGVISKRDSNFPELVELVQTTTMHTATSVRKEIEIRQHEMHKGANTIMRIVQTCNLKGDFKHIKAIAEQNGQAITGFDDSVITDCLMNMTRAKERCLAAFVRCKPLVQWLKELGIASIAGKNVLVDLMFMHAGDEPFNIARVKCFNCAMTGYGPLIFELDESCGSKELLHLCSRVWKELEADPKLPEELMDTNRQLQWLRELMTAHGLVHVTDLMHAEAICTYGIFTVGKNAWENDTNTQNIDGTSMTLANTLKLRVPEQTCTGKIENYTYSQVQDLQFKLGTFEKGAEIVDRFTMIFEGLTEIGMMYTKLCSAGCVLFKNWTADFFCDPDPHKQACVVLQFGQGDEDQLQGRKAKSEGIHDLITEMAKFMMVCLDEWLIYITEARKSYLSLNLFTLDQLIYLQTELAKIETDSEPSDLVYPLLSSLKENCSKEDLVEAMASSREDLDDHHKRKTNKFIQELVLSGYNEAFAMRALEEVDPEDITAGISWCMDHEEDELSDDGYQPQNQSYEHMRKQPLQMDTQHLITTLVSKLGKEDVVGSGPLVQNLNVMWREFLKAMSFSMRDSLSLNHLAVILNNLEKKSTTDIKRTLPIEFKEGQPNLVICEDESVFITALTVYMADKDQPHPQPDEVLTCTNGTKTEEIDIFLRRAFCSESKKIYCLVSVDMLTYDVDEYAARCVEEYLKETHTGSTYRLVVISGYDKQSGFLASLNTFKRQRLHASTEAVREYLHSGLSVQESTSTEYHPDEVIDRERYTVQVIKSWQGGTGKSLCVDRMKERLSAVSSCADSEATYIPLKGSCIHLEDVAERLLPFTSCPNVHRTRIFHIDIYHEVENGVDNLLFNLIVLGYLMDKKGFIWRRSPSDIYLIENTPILVPSNSRRTADWSYVHSLLDVLPAITCRSPRECLCIYKGIFPQDYKDSDQLFDAQMYRSDVFQRPYRYLLRMDKKQFRSESDIELCLQTLLRHCGLEDPSWTDIHYFVLFLNRQLICFENNPFVGQLLAFKQGEDFSEFILKFLIKMSRNFATRSLGMTDKSKKFLESSNSGEREEMIACYTKGDEMQPKQTKQKWENSRHPCLFFNSDDTTFTFIGFLVEQQSGHLIDPKTKQVIELGIMHSSLHSALVRNNVPLSENFDAISRNEKIMRLCTFMGIENSHDPDETFILTTDIVKKIMAIHTRLRYDLPVIIIGETGCGKTRLVKFLCDIQLPPEGGRNTKNLIHMKVPGCSSKDIIKAVAQAEYLAEMNEKNYGDHMHTVLFLDGANATTDIGHIKEIMSDGSMQGKKLTCNKNLKIIAACNHYRKHSDKTIKQMEQEGLAYHMDAINTTDKLGHVPFWCLVYRVYPLPHSLLSLVWDFGQPGADVESVFISQMVKRYIRDAKLPDVPGLIEVIGAILAASQDYMKQHRDERFVISLRDVERALTVMSWFYQESQDGRTIFCLMDNKLYSESSSSEEDNNEVDDITRSLILALGVSYHACLKERQHYRTYIAQYFRAPCHLENGENQIIQEIECCQEVFLDCCCIERNIACNKALKENVFMMVMCVELRIPLLVVGRPGSSKSLAKTIVSDAMQGNASKTGLFRKFKQAQMISFQCSLITAESGIESTFRQCAEFQRHKALDNFVSVVVLDGVDMAENSHGMPLQVLPKLLDDGFLGHQQPADCKKVAFIGISSYTLEPAVVNRGILVQTEEPDLEELKSTAGMIFNTEKDQAVLINQLIEPMVKSYLEIVETTSQASREFFGLRDFYRFFEMVVNFTNKYKRNPTWYELLNSIKRNFGGFDHGLVSVEIFKKNMANVVHFELEPRPSDPDCSLLGLVESQLQSDGRHLLLMTDDYGSLNIIQQTLFKTLNIRYSTIFGSSFSDDQESTKVCHYMNKIKSLMENGSTVILLNLDKLYGSLQDALNQYYVYFGGERCVDLGLSTHRVKCPVHRNFRLIVIEEKKSVYKKFPATLLSRFEKHVFPLKDTLSLEQLQVVQKLEDWVKTFVAQKNVGYFLRYCLQDKIQLQVLKEAKSILLWCATPESLVRLENSGLSNTEKKFLTKLYFTEQAHDSLIQYLNVKLVQQRSRQLFAQITTHSQLISTVHKAEISKETGICAENISILGTLTSFQSEEQFVKTIQHHIQSTKKDPSLVIIQCDAGDINTNLIACARHYVIDQLEKMKDKLLAPVNVVFIVQLQRGASYTGFQCGLWQSVHIDDLETVQI